MSSSRSDETSSSVRVGCDGSSEAIRAAASSPKQLPPAPNDVRPASEESATPSSSTAAP